MLNLETALALLLLSLVVGGGSSIPSVAGQNAVSNITANDIIDLVDNNVIESDTENEIPPTVGSGGSSIPSVAGQNAVSNITANDIIDLVDNNVTESNTENEIPLPLGAIEGLSSIPFVNDADTSYATAGDSILINEVELNPRGNDMAKEWIELYNPTAIDVNIGNFEIRPLFTSATIKLPSDAVIEAGETYVIELTGLCCQTLPKALPLQTQQAISRTEHHRLYIGVTMIVLGRGLLMVITSGS